MARSLIDRWSLSFVVSSKMQRSIVRQGEERTEGVDKWVIG